MRTSHRLFALLTMGLSLGLSACQVAPPPDTAGSAVNLNLDSEIAALMRTVNESELELAELARERAANSNVKEHASNIADQHQAALDRQAPLFSRLGISPVDSLMSQELRTESDRTVSALQSLSGSAFDRAYLDAQTKTQARVLSMLDSQLVPRVQSDELQADLFRMREDVAAQLRRMQELQAWSPIDAD